MIFKPVELIRTNAIYDALVYLNQLPPAALAGMTADQRADCVARNMLMQIGGQADPAVVYRLLAAAGGPADAEEMHKRVAAAQETQATP